MLRTLETLFIVVIVFGSLLGVLQFAVIPSPRISSSVGLDELAASTLKSLDEDALLTMTVFSNDDASLVDLQKALTSYLPPNTVYLLSVYSSGDMQTPIKSLQNFEGELPSNAGTTYYTVSSPEVTITTTHEKISTATGNEITLYIINCNDANGWWITGYTGQTLAQDVYDILSPYFGKTILVNTTYQLGQLLNGTSLTGENVNDAVVINTFGEAVPIPSGYYAQEGYDSTHNSYARYLYYLGQRVNWYNWTWASIVGYPLYYVSNTALFAGSQNEWGIYGMMMVGAAGYNSFLQGLDDRAYSYNTAWITGSIDVVAFTSEAKETANYYGVYPASYQTSTRASPLGTLSGYNLHLASNIFEPDGGYYAGATFTHVDGSSQVAGSLLALGLARTPDVRICALGVLEYYKPIIYRSEFGAGDSTRIVILQLGQLGGG